VFNNGSSLTLDHVALVGNTSPGGSGGGGGVANAGTLTIANSTITGNSALFGAGILTLGSRGTVVMNSSVTNNTGGMDGAGAGMEDQGSMTVVDSTISGNTGLGSAFRGGGIHITASSGGLDLRSSTVSGNVSQGSGGGIDSDGGGIGIVDCTIDGNASIAGSGGGVHQSGGSGMGASDSTITANTDASSSSTNGGGISIEGPDFFLANTIVAGNSTANGTAPDVRGTLRTDFRAPVGNLIGAADVNLVGITDGMDHNQVGTIASPIDPRLGPLQDNGGPTLTRAPLPDSPVIDAGVNVAVPPGVVTDQRGYAFRRAAAHGRRRRGRVRGTSADVQSRMRDDGCVRSADLCRAHLCHAAAERRRERRLRL
jgi:hypothetical protein